MTNNGGDQRNAGWERPRSHSIVDGYSLQASESASPSSNRSNPSPQSCPGGGRLLARPVFNAASPESLENFAPQHDRQSSSGHSFGTPYFQESASVRALQQADPPLGPDYNYSMQRPCIQDNPPIESRYDNWQWPPTRTAPWPSPSPLYPISPEASFSASNFIAQPESAVQDDLLSNWSTQQATLLSKFEAHQSLALQQSTCPFCPDPIEDQNALQVHYWTKHPPPIGFPHSWTPMKCLWNGCLRLKTFKTSSDWLSHAHTVHQKRYRCNVFTCDTGPFGSKADVKRHYLTKHVKPKYCTKTGCQARRRSNLQRKDKLDGHEAKWHGPLMCTIADCPRRHINGEDHGFSKQSELDDHMRRRHPCFQMRNRGN
jgi:hypothetical protein